MEKQALVHVYFGNGKGKTTSAIGIALRALACNYKVHLVQFMKSGKISSEISALQKFPNFSFKRFGAESWFKPEDKLSLEEHRKSAEKALSYLKSCFNNDYDVIIADEILYAAQFSLISEEEVISMIKSRPGNIELILTGSHNPIPKIFELADLVTEIKKIKHPFDKGIQARKGIDF